MSAEFIDSAGHLARFCDTLAGEPWLALDTEFIRERTYYPRLCLIQVATTSSIACIDPLALEDLRPLLERLYDPDCLKVLHAGGQDLEIFHHLVGRPPAPVFDTQIAATLLGHGEQIGYASLVRAELGIDLDKAHTRTDWSQRPLDAAQLEYAADDVRHLRTLYQHLRQRLAELGRLEWLDAEFSELVDPDRYRPEPADAWRRVKGHSALRGVQLAVLAALAEWRERQAMNSDRPRKWILSDEVMLDLARQMPGNAERVARVRGLATTTRERHGETLLRLIAEARLLPQSAWPCLPARRATSGGDEALLDMLMALVRLRAAEHGISAQTLASRRDLEAFLEQGNAAAVCHGWRGHLLARDLNALMSGSVALVVRDGRLQTAAPAY